MSLPEHTPASDPTGPPSSPSPLGAEGRGLGAPQASVAGPAGPGALAGPGERRRTDRRLAERRATAPKGRGRVSGEELRAAILAEARRVITTEGVAALSTRRVAQAVGCTATSIYIYFHSKDALLHAVIDEGMQALHTSLAAAREGACEPLTRLEALARAYVAFGLEHPTLYEVMFLLHPRHMERYPADAYRRARRNVELVAEALADAQGGAPDLTRASTVWALLHGHVALWLAGRIDASIPREAFLDAAIALVRRAHA